MESAEFASELKGGRQTFPGYVCVEAINKYTQRLAGWRRREIP